MDYPHLKRRLKAILLADVVGYSRLMSVDEAGTHVAVNNFTKDLIETKIAEHGRRLIRTIGDRVLVEIHNTAHADFFEIQMQKGVWTADCAAVCDLRLS